MQEKLTFNVTQSENQVSLQGAPEPIFYEIQGIDLPPLADHSFAVWHVLPHAMRRGYDIHIDGPVDPVVIQNAVRFSRTWEMWLPNRFREISITASEEVPFSSNATSGLSFFSGGIDSTYMLLEQGKRMPEAVALTVHGMDYKVDNAVGFQGLRDKTSPLLSLLNYRTIVLKTNVSTIARGAHGWGLSLAGSAFLFSGLFKNAHFAADFSWEQDMVSFPWGLNHVTNRYFRGTTFALSPLSENVTRTEKLELIASNQDALHTVSFCKDQSIRPQNCGNCGKCLRAKAIFVAMTGQLPEIFIDNTFTKASIDNQTLRSNVHRAFFIDLYQQAKTRGTLHLLPGMEQKMNRLRQHSKLKSFVSRMIS